MKKISLFLSVISFVSHINSTVVYTTKDEIGKGTDRQHAGLIWSFFLPSNISGTEQWLANYSSVPFTITNNTKLGGIAHMGSYNPSAPVSLFSPMYVEQYDGSPITVASGDIVTPVMANPSGLDTVLDDISHKPVGKRMHWERYFPNGKGGWNGYPVVNHKGKTITIDKPGYWMFTDIGVFYYQDPFA